MPSILNNKKMNSICNKQIVNHAHCRISKFLDQTSLLPNLYMMNLKVKIKIKNRSVSITQNINIIISYNKLKNKSNNPH